MDKLSSIPRVALAWESNSLEFQPPPQTFPPQRVPCAGSATITLAPWPGVWDAPQVFNFNLGFYAPDPLGVFDVTLRMLPDTEEVQCCVRSPSTGAVVAEKRALFGTALERATRAQEDAAAAAGLAARLADAARREAECASFDGRRAQLHSSTSELHSVCSNLFTLARQKCFLLHQHLQFTHAAHFDLSGGSARKGEVLALACAQRDDVGAVEIQHPHLPPKPQREPPSHRVLSEEEAFASVEDLRTGALRLASAAEHARGQLEALKRSAARAGMEGLGAAGAFSPWEQAQLRLLKAEFDSAAAGVAVAVVRG